MFVVSGIDLGVPSIEVPRADDLDAAVAALPRHPDEDVLLVCAPEALTRPARMYRSVLATDQVALVTIGGPITRRALLTRILLTIPVTHIGMASAVAEEAERHMDTRLATSSANAVAQARPGLRQYLRGMFPGAGFDVDLITGDVTSGYPVDWSFASTGFSVELARPAPRRGHDLEVTGAAVPDVTLETSGSSWKARSWTERTRIPVPPESFAVTLAKGLGYVSCRRCGRVSTAQGCLFCGILPGTPHAPLRSRARRATVTQGAVHR